MLRQSGQRERSVICPNNGKGEVYILMTHLTIGMPRRASSICQVRKTCSFVMQ
jgi:hypothetical protein